MIKNTLAKTIGNVTTGFSYIIMFVTLALQFLAFLFYAHIFMCTLISILLIIGIVCTVLSKDRKELTIRCSLLAFWFTNLLITLINH